MNDVIIAVLHLCFGLFFSFYGILFNKNRFDFIYLSIIYFLLLHWTFFNGECAVSYIIKSINDPEYIPGKDTKNEMDQLYTNDFVKKCVSVIVAIAWVYTILTVFIRNKITLLFYGTFLFFYLFYKLICKFFEDRYSNHFLILQDFVKYSLIIYGFFYLPLLYRKFMSKRK